MQLPGAKATLQQRIRWIAVGKWFVLLLVPALFYAGTPWGRALAPVLVVSVFLALVLLTALTAWELSLRRQYVREARLPAFLIEKLCVQYPQLKPRDAELVLHGLRQFFLAHLRSKRAFVAMPSKVVDAAWHEFILHTKAYAQWCDMAFGRMLHHSPAEVLGRSTQRNDGLRRAWYWSCKEESINPMAAVRLPLLFALDKKYAIEGGFTYLPDCRDIDRQSSSDAYCATSFGGGSGCGGGGDSAGETFSFSDASGCGGDSGGGGGCGGD
jgi:hypothetical protein